MARLDAVAQVFPGSILNAVNGQRVESVMCRLLSMISVAGAARDYAMLWLIQAAFLARYPTEREFREFQRLAFLGDTTLAALSLMKQNPTWAGKSLQYEILIVTDTMTQLPRRLPNCWIIQKWALRW